jgi:hypothetical protein
MMTDSYLKQIDNSPITKKAIKEFDEKVRKIRPEWVGLGSDFAQQQLHSNGELRHAFNGTVELKQFQDMGFPKQAATRKGVTNPDLYDTPNEYAGYRVGLLEAGTKDDPYSNIIKNSPYPHTTYPDQIKGSLVGTTGAQLPFGFWFPDFLKQRRALNKPMSGDSYAIERSDIYQDFNQEWLDQIMPEWEKRIKGIL